MSQQQAIDCGPQTVGADGAEAAKTASGSPRLNRSALSVTLEGRKVLSAGALSIEVDGSGDMLIGLGSHLAAILHPVSLGRYATIVSFDAIGDVPTVDTRPALAPHKARPIAPLVITGPGGDFRRAYPARPYPPILSESTIASPAC